MRVGEVIAGRFELCEVAGSGGMGTVYRARDRASGAVVALKLLRPSDALRSERFAREARVLAQLSHPGIVRYVAHGQTPGGEAYLAMEWLDGEDVSERLARGALPLPDAVTLVAKAAEALAVAHGQGIVHRDVKPSNLFLAGGEVGRVKILDFGIARLTRLASDSTLTTGRIGTPRYMSPEQARGDREVDARADVFSLGCVLYACLCGRAAFLGDDEIAVLAKILLEDPPRPSEVRPGIPAALDQLCLAMLAKDPLRRPGGGAAVATALARVAGSWGVERLGEGTPARPAAARARVLTDREQRLLSVVVAGNPPRQADTQVLTRPIDTAAAAVREAAQRHGGHLEVLDGGRLVVTVASAGAATDQAGQAARCALALRALLPGVPMAIATGRGMLAERLPIGEVIDRAVALVRSATGEGVLVDQLEAGLLDARFDVRGTGDTLALVGEREVHEQARTLLGKPAPFVGRERDLGLLTGIFDECLAERVARAVVIIGPPGVGKSRLRQELVRNLRERAPAGGAAPEVWIGQGDPVHQGSPFGLLAPVVRRAAGILYGEPPAVMRQKLRARLSRHLPAEALSRVSEFAGEMCGVPFPSEASVQLRAARADAMLMGDQIRRAFEEWMQAECAAHPLVIVLEDLQWGDAPTVSLIDGLLRALTDAPCLVLAVARPELAELFPELWTQRAVTRLHLSELSARACERLVREALGPLDPAEVARIVGRAGGNAFYLEELVRAVAEGRGDELPPTVLAMAQARLERLSPDARRVLRGASVFGQVFWQGGVVALFGGARHAAGTREWLSELAAREVITGRPDSRFPGEVEYAFRHSLVREAAYAALVEHDRKLAHRVAGEWLVQAGEDDALALAEHTELGGEPYHAVGYYRRAAEQALESNDFAAAIGRAERGVRCGARGEVLGALRRLQAEASRWRGENAAAEARGVEAMELLPPGSQAWFEAASEVAIAAGRRGKHGRLGTLAGALAAHVPAPGAERAALAAHSRLVMEFLLVGRVAEAERLLDRLAGDAAELGTPDPALAARLSSARAHLCRQRGDLTGFLAHTEAAIDCFALAGNLRGACGPRTNLGLAYIDVGAYARAQVILEDTLAIAERMGLRNVAPIVKHNLGFALGRGGQLEEGLTLEREALAAFQMQGNRRFEGGARVYLASLLIAAGRPDEAETEAREAVETLAVAPPLQPYAIALHALAMLARGRAAEALTALAPIVPLLAEGGAGIEEGEAVVRLAHAEALHATGDHAAAASAIARARARILERAERLPAAQRDTFQASVPEHARTLGLAAQWTLTATAR